MLRAEWESYLDQLEGQPPAIDGVCYLPELGVVEFGGPDASTFLQGYFTCDTATLTDDALTPMAICNLKGRVVANGWCCRRGGDGADHRVLVVLHRSLVEPLGAFLKNYLMFSKTRLNDASDATLAIGASAAIGGLPVGGSLTVMLVQDITAARALWSHHPQGASTAWWLGLIRAGVPLISAATSEEFLPQMLDLDRLGAVNFSKGCYLGQEVVARAQHRGQVKRRLQRLAWEGSSVPQPGATFGSAGDGGSATVINAVATSASPRPAGMCLAVVANDSPGPFEHRDTVLNRVS